MQTHQKTAFKMPYAGIDTYEGQALLYGDRGDFSMLFKIRNPVMQYGADPEPYRAYHHLLLNMVKILGEGYMIQKQDVFARKKWRGSPTSEFLEQKYNEHFNDREYTDISTCLIITRQVKRGAFYVYDKKTLHDFSQVAAKIFDLLNGAGLMPQILNEVEIRRYVSRILGMEFSSPNITLNNLQAGDQELRSRRDYLPN